MLFFRIFSKEKDIIHGILEKKDGPVNLFSRPTGIENVLKMVKKLGWKNITQENLVFAQQVHGNKFFVCPSRPLGGYIKLGVDALISQNKNQILVIRTADCLPILIFDRKEKKVAILHAGREGLLKKIILKTIKGLRSQPENLLVGIGPHIRKCCYFLRKNKMDLLKRKDLQKFIEKRGKKFYLDLTKMAIDQLLKAGVKKENIEDLKICTFCQGKNFFSFRKTKKKEKLLEFGSFIGLKK